MKRLGRLDRLLLLTLVPLWLFLFAVHVFQGVTGSITKGLPFSVMPAAGADDYPTVGPGFGVESTALEPGDRLIRVGEAELRGATSIYRLRRRVEPALVGHHELVVEFERDGDRAEVSAAIRPVTAWWVWIPFLLAGVVAAVVLLLRAPDWPLTRRAFLLFMFAAIGYTFLQPETPGQVTASYVLRFVPRTLAAGLAAHLVYVFPEQLPVGRRWRVWVPCFLGVGLLLSRSAYHLADATDLARMQALLTSLYILFVFHAFVVLAWNYRRSDPIGRRKIKWIVWGGYIGTTPPFLATLTLSLAPLPEAWIVPVALVGFPILAVFPISVLIAMQAHNFLDIDPLISSTTSYSLLLILVLAAFVWVVPTSADALGSLVGASPSSMRVVVSLALAAIVVPLHSSLRPRIDRFFFPERAALDRGVQQLVDEISSAREPRELLTLVGERLADLVRPQSCVVYTASGDGFAPVFVRGKAIPPAFEHDTSLIPALRGRSEPLVSERWSRAGGELSSFDRAALETLGAALVLPVQRPGELAGFVCLGPKRSNDVYTSTDLALLGAVTAKLSTELARFDDAALLREARVMQEELRRYVPGAIARSIEAGRELPAGEQPVSVLFVDIRGYTSYAESQRSTEIFSTVNRYTTTVSAIVEKFGGSIVEFNGDGMMAVFGAPELLPDKERAAVRAGAEMVEAVQSLGGRRAGTELSVGVGIATGPAYVGSIRAVDRLIWTALGNTTNLAARLQGLTRDVDAAMVIDRTTWAAAGDVGLDFELREQMPIRGRSQREDIYVQRENDRGRR